MFQLHCVHRVSGMRAQFERPDALTSTLIALMSTSEVTSTGGPPGAREVTHPVNVQVPSPGVSPEPRLNSPIRLGALPFPGVN